MKIHYIILLFALFLGSCSKEERNPTRLPNIHFQETINLDLPLYNKLKTPLNPVILPYIGLKGVVVVNVGREFYAWEMSCPNYTIADCGALTLKDALFVECPCDGLLYNLVSGEEVSKKSKIPLLMYATTHNNNLLIISN